MENLESLNDFITSGHGDNVQIMCMRSETSGEVTTDCDWNKIFPQAESLVSIIDAALNHYRRKHQLPDTASRLRVESES